MGGHLRMNENARSRKSVLDRVMEGELTQVEASKLLGFTDRPYGDGYCTGSSK